MEQVEDGAPLVIADVTIDFSDALDALRKYPRRTPWAYDLSAAESEGITPAQRLERTRKLSSRLSAASLEDMVERSEDAPWDERLATGDLADLRPGDSLWAAADAVYLHFLHPKMQRVGFAKVHKYLHLVYPTIIPILDTKVRCTYRGAQRALSANAALAGTDNWRRRTWLAIGMDLSANRSSGALDGLRNGLQRIASAAPDGDPREARHARRLLELGDLRLLDMLTWKAAMLTT